VNTAPGSVFTTLYFLRTEHMITLGWKGLIRDKRSMLLGSFVSYKENKVLQITRK